jgi:ATP-dependent protease ClpP protease subunit
MPSWNEILADIQQRHARAAQTANGVLDQIRREFLAKLHQQTGRNIIAYYSGFLSKPQVLLSEINAEDLNGFMMAVHTLKTGDGLDLILHTPGGDISATISIVHYLRQKFGNDIRAIVPQIAMSAGTMIACSCKEIIMARHSQLGPTDPHLYGIPAAGVIKEFKRACREVKRDPSRAEVWQHIIGQYRPTFLSRCENAIAWSKSVVIEQLRDVMFNGESKAAAKAATVVRRLTDYSKNKSHDRPIHYEECAQMGLRVKRLEDDPEMQDTVLSVHHCYMHAFMNGTAFKIIENHKGAALVKQQLVNSKQS